MEAYEIPTVDHFGTEGMKRLKVCSRCGGLAFAHRYTCPDCGCRLPPFNLFQRYQQHHRLCPECDTVLSDGMKFCPHCGMKITVRAFSKKEGGIGK